LCKNSICPRNMKTSRMHVISGSCLFLCDEDWGSRFLQNVSHYLQDSCYNLDGINLCYRHHIHYFFFCNMLILILLNLLEVHEEITQNILATVLGLSQTPLTK
jgi:hypothetical protein